MLLSSAALIALAPRAYAGALHSVNDRGLQDDAKALDWCMGYE
jgi:hypothetical protein